MAEEEFFDNASEQPQQPEGKEKVEELEKIKVGSEEYSQNDLDKLVNLGKIAQEAEEKYDRPISKYWPDYTKTKQDLVDSKERILELEKASRTTVQGQPGNTPASNSREEVLRQAEEYGILTKDTVTPIINEIVQGNELLKVTESLVKQVEVDGKPSTTVDALLEHMDETGIKVPEKAYKDMFESELDVWKENQLKKIKPQGLKTQETSTAGSKQPEPETPKTMDQLESALKAHLNRAQGAERG